MVKLMQRVLFLWGPPAVWAVLIYYLSSISGLAVGEGAVDFWTRKPAHVVEYAILFLLLFRAIRGGFGKKWRVGEIGLGAGVLAFVYAVSDEIHQVFVPLRTGKIGDLGFDLLGILAGLFLAHFYLRQPSKKP